MPLPIFVPNPALLRLLLRAILEGATVTEAEVAAIPGAGTLEDVAQMVLRLAQQYVPHPPDAPYATGELLSTLAIERTAEGFRLVCGTDHWVFVEYGAPAHNMEPQSFMRRARDEAGLKR